MENPRNEGEVEQAKAQAVAADVTQGAQRIVGEDATVVECPLEHTASCKVVSDVVEWSVSGSPPMPISCKYVHTNLVARDWRGLATFYQEVFDCRPVGSERDYDGGWIRDVTALETDVSIQGQHLRLPGVGDDGPTLEIFQYSQQPQRPPIAANQPGFAHIAFHIDDMPAARQAVLDGGGQDLGKMHSMDVPGAGRIELIYMTDPEGNIIELQKWSKQP